MMLAPFILTLQDFQESINLQDELLAHYTSQWRDREIYWLCRQRSRSVGDVLCCIIDSYDKAKIMLPAYPQKRTPKSQVYEVIRRILAILICNQYHGAVKSQHEPANILNPFPKAPA